MSNNELFDYLGLAADLSRIAQNELTSPQQCQHICRSGKHLLMSHAKGDTGACDKIERALGHGQLGCESCDWALGSDYTDKDALT